MLQEIVICKGLDKKVDTAALFLYEMKRKRHNSSERWRKKIKIKIKESRETSTIANPIIADFSGKKGQSSKWR